MDIKYFRSQIVDELEGSYYYIKKAIEIRLSHPKWANKLAEMSESELQHSSNLYDMFEEYCKHVTEKNDGETPLYIKHAFNELMDVYSDMMTKITRLHEMYKEKQHTPEPIVK